MVKREPRWKWSTHFKERLVWCESTRCVHCKKYWENICHKTSRNRNHIWWLQGLCFWSDPCWSVGWWSCIEKIQARYRGCSGQKLPNFCGLISSVTKYTPWLKKWQTMIEAHVDVKTIDGYLRLLFCVGFTKKYNDQSGESLMPNTNRSTRPARGWWKSWPERWR